MVCLHRADTCFVPKLRAVFSCLVCLAYLPSTDTIKRPEMTESHIQLFFCDFLMIWTLQSPALTVVRTGKAEKCRKISDWVRNYSPRLPRRFIHEAPKIWAFMVTVLVSDVLSFDHFESIWPKWNTCSWQRFHFLFVAVGRSDPYWLLMGANLLPAYGVPVNSRPEILQVDLRSQNVWYFGRAGDLRARWESSRILQ
jgi:hypothetical protein